MPRRGPRDVSTVLLVDEHVDGRQMYAEFLRTQRFRTLESGNVGDALALAAMADVVVTEIRVPGPFDGLEFVRQLRADGPTKDKPIIVLTASAFEADERHAREAGCDRFVSKPCLPHALVEIIHSALAARAPRPRSAGASPRPKRQFVA
jgi:two-component system, cell cycle response regulator DivK